MNRWVTLTLMLILIGLFNDVSGQCITAKSGSYPIPCTKEKGAVALDSIRGGTPPYTFYLDGVSNGSDSVFLQVELGSHTVKIEDSDTCETTLEISVIKGECPPLSPSPVVSPNDDGTNDGWIILGLNNYPETEVWIYTRWGQRIYHSKEYSNEDPWEGRYLGKILPTGAYYYLIDTHYESPSGEEIKYKGVVSVVK